VARAVEAHLDLVTARGESVDYLTVVTDGEPTLDLDMGATLRALRDLGLPLAVITNGSLLHLPEVRRDLSEADWVSVKVDTVRPNIWRRMNRAHGRLDLATILGGVQRFAHEFEGRLHTETMLVQGLNDSEPDLRATAHFLEGIQPRIAYLAVPTRPTAERWARAPGPDVLTRGYEVFRAWLPRVELLLGYEGDEFGSTGDARADLLAVTAVHPMREAAVGRLLERDHADWTLVESLMAEDELVRARFGPHRYYLRRPRHPRPEARNGGSS
jgi:wyosine [tRNA(Phe)-imidazoG37] synthetase (radical SAM superfamily)